MSKSSNSIGFLGILIIVLITLKLTNYIGFSWWWVILVASSPWLIALISIIILSLVIKNGKKNKVSEWRKTQNSIDS